MMKMLTERPNSRRSSDRRRLTAVVALVLVAGFRPAPEAISALADLPRIEMKGNLLLVNGQPLRFEDRLETWTRALGPPSTSDDSRHRWYGTGVEIWAPRTADGRAYVKTLIVRMGDHGFPGVFVLQGVSILRGGPSFKEVQAALQGTDVPILGLGQDRLPESGKMTVRGPDGFDVTVAARLACPNPPPPGSNEDCEQIIDELEIGSSW